MCFRAWRVGIVKCDHCNGSKKEPAGTVLNPYNDGMPSPPCSKCHGTGEVRPPPIFPQRHACDDCPGGIFPHVECRACLIVPKRVLPKLSPEFYARRAEMLKELDERKQKMTGLTPRVIGKRRDVQESNQCPRCGGSGKLPGDPSPGLWVEPKDNYRKCPACGGTGNGAGGNG